MEGVALTVPPTSQNAFFLTEFQYGFYPNGQAGPGGGLDVGVFGTGTATVPTTYRFVLRDNTLTDTTTPGITAGNNIIVTSAKPKPADPIINVFAITNLTGGPFPAPGPLDKI